MYFRLMGKLNARRQGLLEEDEKGFTLIELLVVVIIIGILAAIAIPIYIGVQNNAKDSAVKNDLSNAKTALVSSYTNDPTQTTIPALSTLTALGYTSSGNYTGTGGSAPTLAANSTFTLFCIQATSADTKNPFFVSTSSGVTKGACPTASTSW